MEIGEVFIGEESSMLESMRRLDQVARKVLFVTRENRLVASITDGDIRRWILKKGSLNASVKDIANYAPKYLHEREQFRANGFMKEHGIDAVPIVNDQREVVSIFFLNEEALKRKKDLKVPVVIMAGGLGSRLYPYTKVLPKPLIPIGEIPIAEHIMNRFHQYGVDEFHLIVNHKKNMIKAYFNEIEKAYKIYYVDEDKPLGTAGGLYLLKEKICTTFILSNCDILIDEDYEKIVRFHQKERNWITMVCSLKHVQIPYGIVEIAENGEIEEMKEKPTFSFFTNTGMYIVQPEVLKEMEDGIAIDFPDIIDKYKRLRKRIGIYPISGDRWMDMGQPEELELMKKRLERDFI